MDDIVGAIVGVVFCFGIPVAGLAALVYLLTRRGDAADETTRRDRLEMELERVKSELLALRNEHRSLKASHEALEVHVAALITKVAAAAGAATGAPPVVERERALARVEARPPEPTETSSRPDAPSPAEVPSPIDSQATATLTQIDDAAMRAAGVEAHTAGGENGLVSPPSALSAVARDPAPPAVAPSAGDAPTSAAASPVGASAGVATSAASATHPAPTAALGAAAAPPAAAAAAHAAGPTPSPTRAGTTPPPLPPRPVAATEPAAPDGGGLEQWIGVRGAAAAGAIVLVIAGLYFFQYSIEHGLIGPSLRVALGALVGLGCVVASDTVLRTRAPALAPWLAGAGIAILYGAAWALSALYHLAPAWVSGVLMVATTASATGLAVRRDAFPIAVLGLLGGFITPIALSSGEDHPIPLFSYLLVLDAAILFVSHRRGWPSLGLLALLATAVYQLGWLTQNMQSSTLAIGAGIVVAFSALFALVPAPRPKHDDGADDALPLPIATRAGAALLPFLFVLTFAFRDDALAHGWLTVGLTTVACLGTVFVGRRFGHGWLPAAASVGAAAVVAVWLVRWPLGGEHIVHLCALVLLPALVFQLHVELCRHRTLDALGAAGVSTLAPMGTIAIALMAGEGAAIEPVLLVLVVLCALAVRTSSLVARPGFMLVVPLVSVVAFLALDLAGAHEGSVPSPSFLLALLAVPSVIFSVGALLARAEARPPLDVGVALAACLSLGGLGLVSQAPTTDAWSFALTATALLLIGLFATARRAPSELALALVVASALAETVWAAGLPPEGQPDLRLPTLAFAVLTFAAWPLFARNVGRTPSGWRAAALAGPAFFLGLRRGWIGELGADYVGLLPVTLAVLVLAVAFAARRRTRSDPATQRVATVWLAAVAAGFVTLAIPLQLRNEWLTIGWALEAAALLLLDYRLRHAGLRWLALALLGAVFVRLCMNEYVLHYYARGEWRIFNWLTYTYLVPAAAMVAGALVLRRHEVASRVSAERAVLGGYAERPLLSGVIFGGVVLIVFSWLNLTIFDWFASGPALTIPFERMPARDLTISIVWAVYALCLLALGMARKSTALRVTSLLLILVTCGKVFLYDLSTLEDLYRVAALVGLALSLIVVSLFYQRFVFRRDAAQAQSARGGT